MSSNKSKVIIAGLMIAMAILLFWLQSIKPKMNLRPSTAVGEILADEVGRMLEDKGKVVIIGRSVSRDGIDTVGQQIKSLQAALSHRGDSPAIEWLPGPALGTMDMGGISPGTFMELLEKHKDSKAWVVFAGLPPFSPELAEKVSARSLKLLAVCGYNRSVRNWLEARALVVAVVPRSDELPAGTPPPRTAADWFQREFQILTFANVGGLAY